MSDEIEKLQAEFDEFKQSSREYEAELESEVRSAQEAMSALKREHGLKTADLHRTIGELQQMLEQRNAELADMKSKKTSLEQSVDALEMKVRMLEDSLASSEGRADQLTERVAMLEQECEDLRDRVKDAEDANQSQINSSFYSSKTPEKSVAAQTPVTNKKKTPGNRSSVSGTPRSSALSPARMTDLVKCVQQINSRLETCHLICKGMIKQ
jgi:chromosome segregation ATPase